MTIHIHRIPAFQTNYLFVLHHLETQTAAVVDPGDAGPILAHLDRLGATLTTILNTHHHADHVGGNRELLQRYPTAQVYGGQDDRGRIPGQTVFLNDGDRCEFGGQEAIVLFVPGHTRAHIAYYFPSSTPGSPQDPPVLGASGDLFCGDTLFAAGCGRLFEGTPEQMLNSLNRLRQLPETTRVWCAHEYTLNNLEFALTVEPGNADLQARYRDVQSLRSQNIPTVPSAIALEKRTNPFLRWEQPEIQKNLGTSDPVRTFARLRGKKDLF